MGWGGDHLTSRVALYSGRYSSVRIHGCEKFPDLNKNQDGLTVFLKLTSIKLNIVHLPCT